MCNFLFEVRVTREKITWPGATIKKKEQGMPSYDNNNLFGDLFITFDVDFPRSTLDAEEKEGMCYLLYVQLKGALQSVCKQSLCLHFCVQNIELYSTTIYIFKLLEYNK